MYPLEGTELQLSCPSIVSLRASSSAKGLYPQDLSSYHLRSLYQFVWGLFIPFLISFLDVEQGMLVIFYLP